MRNNVIKNNGFAFDWQEITRDERYFCAELYFLVRDDLIKFINVLNKHGHWNNNLSIDPDKVWQLGYEVSFYRDMHNLYKMDIGKFSYHRAFDLCLFSKDEIFIIEAKAHGGFETGQNKSFFQDKTDIPQMLQNMPTPFEIKEGNVYIIALASSQYFDNKEKYGRDDFLENVDAYISWNTIAGLYGDHPMLKRADYIYKK